MQYRTFSSPALTLVLGAALLAGCGDRRESSGDSNGSGSTTNGAGSTTSASGSLADACYTCGLPKCPTEAAACEASAGCSTLLSCLRGCPDSDPNCSLNCQSAAGAEGLSTFTTGIALCATTQCLSECTGGAATNNGSGGGTGVSVNTGGAAAVATGGGATSGGSTTGGAGVATVAAVSDAYSVTAEGYVTASGWAGFAWTATDDASASTIAPADFSMHTANASLCASGTVVATSDYSAVAMVGISLKQGVDEPESAAGTWEPTGAGIQWSVDNTANTTLRLQIQAAGGDANENLRWCTTLSGGTGTAYWSDFNTTCWDGEGTNYDGTTPLEAAMVLVPGEMTDTPFDFCINELQPN